MTRTPEDDRLLAQAATWEGGPLSPTTITGVSRRHGIDLATAILYHQLSQRPDTSEFLTRLRGPIQPPDADILIAVVPGAFHREHRKTGADGARIVDLARQMGLSAEVIPTAGFGRLTENAQTIHRWLQAHRSSRIGLISLSKGGADVKQALALGDAEQSFRHVVSWVSLSGLVQGTPLIDWLRRRPWRWWAIRGALWWRGHPGATLLDLRHGPQGMLAFWPALPPHLTTVHVCGFPLGRHLAHPWAPRAYGRLSPLGPNDGGGILLGDLLEYPGLICPVWGADHYLSPRWDATSMLTGIIAASLSPRHATRSASQPKTPPASKSNA